MRHRYRNLQVQEDTNAGLHRCHEIPIRVAKGQGRQREPAGSFSGRFGQPFRGRPKWGWPTHSGCPAIAAFAYPTETPLTGQPSD